MYVYKWIYKKHLTGNVSFISKIKPARTKKKKDYGKLKGIATRENR